ncbi:MAG: proton-conducting transporter membrane subunit [Bacteroidia bacterium]
MTSKTTYLNSPLEKPLSVRIITAALWLLFLGNLLFTAFFFPNIPAMNIGNVLKINGFTLLLWTTVSFFSAVIASYAGSYFKDKRQMSRFIWHCAGFTLSVMLFVIAEHLLLLIAGWLLMGYLMARLIGLQTEWGDAREARRFTQGYFLLGGFFLAVGVLLPGFWNNVFTLSGLMASMGQTPAYILLISAVCIIIAALIQSAIFPFHRWLLSAMTAPTPASALMHAGFVNGSGILLTMFGTILLATNTLEILFVIGGLTAIVAQFTKLIQVNVKQRLACSTIAQMGFMIMQCGLGFFNAAIAHLILHGFYKAYLFLSSGEEIERSAPQEAPRIRIKWLQAVFVLIFSLLGAWYFSLLTGKGTAWDSGIFLTLIASITVGQVTYNIVKQQLLSGFQKIAFSALLFIAGISIYAIFYQGVTLLMAGMDIAVVPSPISWVHVVFGIVFLIGFFLMKLGSYRKSPWLYVKLMNLSQPREETTLMHKTKFQ